MMSLIEFLYKNIRYSKIYGDNKYVNNKFIFIIKLVLF